MGPKDDCESWFYLLLDLILVGGLPWKKLNEKNEVLLAKEECRKEKRHTLYTGLKYTVELNKILVYIDSQAYQDRIDYQFIYKSLEEVLFIFILMEYSISFYRSVFRLELISMLRTIGRIQRSKEQARRRALAPNKLNSSY